MGREGLVVGGTSPKARSGISSANGLPTGSVAIVPVTRFSGGGDFGGGGVGGGGGLAHAVAVTNMGMRPTPQPGKSWVRQRPPQQQQQKRGGRGEALEEAAGEFGRW